MLLVHTVVRSLLQAVFRSGFVMPLPDDTLSTLVMGKSLSAAQSETAFSAVMDGSCSDAEIAALLTALRMKGEHPDEVVGAARVMRSRCTRIPTRRMRVLDTCGTGGDGLATFNISTAAAIVVAGCGIPVAKHGNRGVSSRSGSADVLEQLGVNLQLTPDQVATCIDETGIGFCFAPLLHGAMKHAAAVRKQLKFRSIFNLLGPLTNPASAEFQLLGTNSVGTAELLAQSLAKLGTRHAIVVCGGDGLDEVSLWGETTVFEVTGAVVERRCWTAETFGLPPCDVAALRVDSPAESAELIRKLLDGEVGPAQDIVVANAAAALLAAEECGGDPLQAADRANHSISSGAAKNVLNKLIAASLRSV